MTECLSEQSRAEVKIRSCELSLWFREPGKTGTWYPDPGEVNRGGENRKNQRPVGCFSHVPRNVMLRLKRFFARSTENLAPSWSCPVMVWKASGCVIPRIHQKSGSHHAGSIGEGSMQQGGCESLLLGDAANLPCYRKSSGCGSGSILGYCSTKIRLSQENDNRGLDLVFLYTLEKRVTSTVPSLSSFKWILL